VPRLSQPPYRVVSAAVRQRVEAGEWLPGEQLPTVREIAEQYGVSIATARKALAVLAEDGLLVATPGWGVFRAES
jgi:DNA-binding GntR family transcriptional regulator